MNWRHLLGCVNPLTGGCDSGFANKRPSPSGVETAAGGGFLYLEINMKHAVRFPLKQTLPLLALVTALATAPVQAGPYNNDGSISGWSLVGPSTVVQGSSIGLTIQGIPKPGSKSAWCAAIAHFDSSDGGNVQLLRDLGHGELPRTVQVSLNDLAQHFGSNYSEKLPPGAYRLTLEPRKLYGDNPCPSSAQALQLTVLAPPPDLNALNLVIRDVSGKTGPFIQGQSPNFTYRLESKQAPGAPWGSCQVNTTISGPQSMQITGKKMDASSNGVVPVTQPGTYTLTLVPSYTAPVGEQCVGGPISKSFEIVDLQAITDALKSRNSQMLSTPGAVKKLP